MSEVNENGNKVERSQVGSYDAFLNLYVVATMQRLYDNGYTAAYFDCGRIVSYCEGDICVLTGGNLEKEAADHLEYFNENC